MHTDVGLYKDEPGKVPAEELRSLAGVVLDADAAKKCGLPSKALAAQTTLQTVFPFHGCLSIMVGVFKCYRALDDVCKGNTEDKYGECIEVYEWDARKLTFHMLKI